jgi:glycosyltransferase involved in cell wall biosynthesis
MDLSIVIPTFNNAKLLSRTLDNFLSILPVSGIEIEIVITNNNSTDDTDKVIKQYSNKLPIKMCFQPQQGISIAKNTSILNSTGKLIIFTDDDVRPCLEWINSYWEGYCNNPEGYFWGGAVDSDFESTRPSEKLLKYAPASVRGTTLGDKERILESDEYFIGANWACTRKALDQVGLFNVDIGLNPLKKTVLVGEETDLMSRLKSKGYSGLYFPNTIIYHYVPASKASLQHIAERNEAYVFYSESNKYRESVCYRTSRWYFRSIIENYIKFNTKKMVGIDYSEEYIRFMCAKGAIRALIARK